MDDPNAAPPAPVPAVETGAELPQDGHQEAAPTEARPTANSPEQGEVSAPPIDPADPIPGLRKRIDFLMDRLEGLGELTSSILDAIEGHRAQAEEHEAALRREIASYRENGNHSAADGVAASLAVVSKHRSKLAEILTLATGEPDPA